MQQTGLAWATARLGAGSGVTVTQARGLQSAAQPRMAQRLVSTSLLAAAWRGRRQMGAPRMMQPTSQTSCRRGISRTRRYTTADATQ